MTTTIGRGLVGIFFSVCMATVFSLLFARTPALYEWFRPLLTIMRSVPVISFILLALLFLNPETIPLLIGFLTMFPLLTENLTKELLCLDKDILRMGKAFSLSRPNYFLHILYPQLKPFLYSGLSSAVGFGWRAIIMGEVLSQCTLGIGSGMKKAQLFIEVPELLAWTAIAVLISFVADKIISKPAQWNPSVYYGKETGLTFRQVLPATLSIRNLSFSYEAKEVLNNFSITIPPSSMIGIQGASGSGKTTLIYLISHLLPVHKGIIGYSADAVFSWVFQTPILLPHLSVYDNIALPLAGKIEKQQIPVLLFPVLKQLQIEELKERFPDELSYGQQQRVSIARGLLYPANFLLMDEPFKGLEKELVKKIIEIIKEHQTLSHQTIVFASHQPDELSELAQQIVTI
ncbi:MAG: ATP-binding cassette domain-containing protein [Tannerellaceae bacterium]|nr:ATP-binding cassette domain-containing protein [Tannerellaceae bacterium]